MSFLLAATTTTYWFNLGVLLLAALGVGVAVRMVLDRLYRLPFRPNWWVALVTLIVIATIAFDAVLIRKVGLRGPRLLRDGSWSEVPIPWLLVIAGGLTAIVVQMFNSTRAALAPITPLQTQHSARRESPASHVGRPLRGRGLNGFIAKFPGNELFEFDVIERHVNIPRLPRELDGLSLVHLSDSHFNGTPELAFFERATEAVRELKPDLIAMTGDILDHHGVADWLPTTYGKLSAPLGCYFILGNHDIYDEPEKTRTAMSALGWQDVSGRALRLDVRRQSILLAGSERPWLPALPDLNGHHDTALRILLTHSPREVAWARRHAFDLLLAGHYHGGQIRLPVLGPMHSGRYVAGLYHAEPTLIHVSRGIGQMTPVRFRCAPELTKLVLHARA